MVKVGEKYFLIDYGCYFTIDSMEKYWLFVTWSDGEMGDIITSELAAMNHILIKNDKHLFELQLKYS